MIGTDMIGLGCNITWVWIVLKCWKEVLWNCLSRTKEVNLIFFILSFLFYFIFHLFSFILFLEPGLGLE